MEVKVVKRGLSGRVVSCDPGSLVCKVLVETRKVHAVFRKVVVSKRAFWCRLIAGVSVKVGDSVVIQPSRKVSRQISWFVAERQGEVNA